MLHPNSKRMSEHKIEAVAILCQDPRLSNDDGDRKAARETLGTQNVEFIKIAGGAGAIAPISDTLHSKDFIHIALKVAIEKHGAKRVLLTNHTECGAFSIAGFNFNSAEEEKEFHSSKLLEAKNQVLEWFPQVEEVLIGFMTVDAEDNIVIELVN